MNSSFSLILASLAVAATVMTLSGCATQSTKATAASAAISKPIPAAETSKPGVATVPGTASTSKPAAANTSKVRLTVVKVDSEETEGEDGRGVNAVDGDPNTFWHTQWQANSPEHPHEIIIELTPPAAIKGFTCLPRQDDSENGAIKDYEFYVSDDGIDFGPPISKGTFDDSKTQKTVNFGARQCRFIKLKALSEVNDQPWTSAAEIGVVPEN